jgi:hypothetical protein
MTFFEKLGKVYVISVCISLVILIVIIVAMRDTEGKFPFIQQVGKRLAWSLVAFGYQVENWLGVDELNAFEKSIGVRKVRLEDFYRC